MPTLLTFSPRRAFLALLVSTSVLVASPGHAIPADDVALRTVVGDYTVPGYPNVLGFLLVDGRLHLKVGGVGGDGRAVPLLAKPNGRYALSDEHPNEFEFKVDGDSVEFNLWSAGKPLRGARKGATAPPGAPQAQSPSRDRVSLAAEIATAESAARAPGADEASRLRFAKLLLETGEFWRAREIAAPLADASNASSDAVELAARLEFLTGAYGRAEALYDRLVARQDGDSSRRIKALVGKMFVLYQQNRFDAIQALPFPPGAVLPNVTHAKAFAENPYGIEWSGDERVTHVPFLATDPLPLLTIEVNGVPIQVLFDTGADQLVLDKEIAAALGVAPVTTATGTFGGGLPAEVGFGQVARVSIGSVTLRRVPVTILPTKRFSPQGTAYVVGGIVGTSVMRQFLGTLDYRNGRLSLRERTPAQAAALRAALGGRLSAEIPFVLDGTHLLHARGSLNGREGLTFFVDSGLAADAAFAAPPQTLDLLKIPKPELRMPEKGEGGGGRFAQGSFPIGSLGLGPLRQTNLTGLAGALTAASYTSRGFLQDGLISHRFLRKYASWTLDFDSRTFLFEK